MNAHIDASLLAEPQDVAEIRDGTAVVRLSRTEAGLAALRADLEGRTYELTTVRGNDAARADRQRCVALRASTEKLRKTLKAPALEFGRLIDAEAKRITEAVEALEAPIDAAIKADEKRRADEKLARERAEALRLESLRATVDGLLSRWVERCQVEGITAARITGGLVNCEALECPAELADVAAYWTMRHAVTLTAMRQRRDECARAEESARLAAERAELERQRAEIEAAAEAQRAEAARLESERQALIEQQMRQLDQAEDRAIQAPAEVDKPAIAPTIERVTEVGSPAEPVAVSPVAQVLVAENQHQQQAGFSLLSPVDAAADDAGAEAVAAANDAPAQSVPFDLEPDATDLLGDPEACQPEPPLEDKVRALLAHIDAAFSGRFPRHPKPDAAWWDKLAAMTSNLKTEV